MTADQLGSLDIPSPGFGTLRIDEGHVAESVETAIETGYRHIDAAQMYENEAAVGEGIAAAGVPREDLFVATKILHPFLRDEVEYDQTIEDAESSLGKLGIERADLLYIHWPDDYDLQVAFEAFEALADDGRYDHLGVCNFTPELLEEASDIARDDIEALQVEMHPLLQQRELRDYCANNDIAMVAYCPLVRGQASEVEELVEVADKHGASPEQVSLAWVESKGVVPIPKATSAAHIQDNWASRDLELDEEDVATIDGIDREERQVDPPFAVW
jgi:2,5-diketo-D-gluconate reductase B